jgi:hypothetical protein
MILKDGPDADLQRAVYGHGPKNISHDSTDSEDDAKYAVIRKHNKEFVTNFDDFNFD